MNLSSLYFFQQLHTNKLKSYKELSEDYKYEYLRHSFIWLLHSPSNILICQCFQNLHRLVASIKFKYFSVTGSWSTQVFAFNISAFICLTSIKNLRLHVTGSSFSSLASVLSSLVVPVLESGSFFVKKIALGWLSTWSE